MAKHRRPQHKVSKDIKPHKTERSDTFDPVEALQNLHLHVVELEALANAAGDAVVQLPFPPGREARQPFDRVYALVTRVADETNSAVAFGNELMAELTRYLQRKGAEA